MCGITWCGIFLSGVGGEVMEGSLGLGVEKILEISPYPFLSTECFGKNWQDRFSDRYSQEVIL